jgi:GT2 family glycosyltransferase
MNPTVAVVILNYNGKNYLEKFLPGVVSHLRKHCQVIVADNASTDDSLNFLNQFYPEIQCITLEKNVGFAGGYNEALSKISADYYALLNSDVEVVEDWVTPIVEKMQQNHQIAAAQPKILDYRERQYFEYAGACGGFIDILGYPFCRGRILHSIEKDLGQYDKEMEIFWASGAAKIIRAKDFHAAGGFDTNFFAHMEEIDLCYRLKRMNKLIMVYPEAKVYHVGGGTLPYHDSRKIFLNFRNSLLMLLKNKTIFQLTWVLPLRMILDGMAAWLYILKGNTGGFIAVFRSHLAFYQLLKPTWKKRQSDVKHIPQKLINKTGMLSGIVPLHFYLLGNKRFYTLQLNLFSGKI